MKNILSANFSHAKEVKARGLYQWDYGQILNINGISLEDPFEVHFCNVGDSQTVTMIGENQQVEIPDSLLETGKDIQAFVYLHEGGSDGETEYVAKLSVQKRPQPSDGSPTPAQQSAIDTAIALLQQELEQVDQYTLTYNGNNSYYGRLQLKKNDTVVNTINADQKALATSSNLVTSKGAYGAAHWIRNTNHYQPNPISGEEELIALFVQIEPFIFYNLGYIGDVYLDFAPTTEADDGYLKEYRIMLTCPNGYTDPAIHLPDGVIAPAGFTPQEGHTYEIRITWVPRLGTYATITDWSNS